MITEKTADVKGNRFLSVITEPTEYPVTVSEIKEFARIDGNDEDSILETFLSGVVNNVENYLGRALITRTYKLIMDEWNQREIELMYPPLISVSSVNTVDESNVETVYDSDYYYVITESIPGRLIIKKDSDMPTNTERDYAGFNIKYIAGYGSASSVPKQIKIAIMQWVTMIYEKRSMTSNEVLENEPPPEVAKILRPFRIIKL